MVSGAQFLAEASRFIGIPYVWGGTSTTGVDCSGLVALAAQDLGLTGVPRTSQGLSAYATPITASQAQPGDLVFYGGAPGDATHVGIYAGGGQMLDAAHAGTNVRIESDWPGAYFGRLPNVSQPTGGNVSLLSQLLAAIRGQESGGNYGDVNSTTGALGAYQVMPANLPSWSAKALGHTDTPAQFLASPSDQDKVASSVLGGYLSADGAAGAAAAWYSGDPNRANDTTPVNGGPSVADYVQSVLARMSQTSTAATTSDIEQTGTGGDILNYSKDFLDLLDLGTTGQLPPGSSPASALKDFAKDIFDLNGIEKIAIEVVAVVAGLGLVVLGAARAAGGSSGGGDDRDQSQPIIAMPEPAAAAAAA